MASILALLTMLSHAHAGCADVFSFETKIAQPAHTWVQPRARNSPLEAFSEQLPSFRLDSGIPAEMESTLRQGVRALAKRQGREFELEFWPSWTWDGKPQWVFLRVRKSGQDWQWVKKLPGIATPETPTQDLFATREDDLYYKPQFRNSVWFNKKSGEIVTAWPQSSSAPQDPAKYNVLLLPQPAQALNQPVSFRLKFKSGKITLPRELKWKPTRPSAKRELPKTYPVQWRPDFQKAYATDLEILSGTRAAQFPLSRRKITFKRKNNVQSPNDLDRMLDYLTERYEMLGFRAEKQSFEWNGQMHSNLIVKIPGENSKRPILVADHVDTAFAEDTFRKTGKRVSVPGSDDNVTASVALLRTAETLAQNPPQNEVWLVHLTGEEFPADCLGARHLSPWLIQNGIRPRGIFLMDMIGYRKRGDSMLFQISAGNSAESLSLAELTENVAREITPTLEPVTRTYDNDRSYLFNTDGLIFSYYDFPVVLVNEHLNRQHRLHRRHYHESTDRPENVDLGYAVEISKAVIAAILTLANQ